MLIPFLPEKLPGTPNVTSAWFAANGRRWRVLGRKLCRFPDSRMCQSLCTSYSGDSGRSRVRRLILDFLGDDVKCYAFIDVRGKVHHQQRSIAMRAYLEWRRGVIRKIVETADQFVVLSVG